MKHELPITVCIPTYNGERYLAEAIRSVLLQIDKISCVIVSDDGSKDSTIHIVNSFNHKKIKKVFHKKNLGMVGNWNYLIESVDTEYLTIFHQDDVYYPNYFEKVYESILNQGADLGYTDVETLNSKNEKYFDPKFEIKRRISSENRLWEGQKMLRTLFYGCFINCPTVMYKTEIFNKVGFFDASYQFVQDWDFWFRVALSSCKASYIPSKLYGYRIHESNATTQYRSNHRKYDERLGLLDSKLKVIKHLPDYSEYEEIAEKSLKNVLVWDALEDLAQKNYIAMKDKINYGDSKYVGFRNYKFRKIVLFCSYLGPYLAKLVIVFYPTLIAVKKLIFKSKASNKMR